MKEYAEGGSSGRRREERIIVCSWARGVRDEGAGAGAGAWTCAWATAWNSQHWLREGAWRIEGVSHRPSAQQRARKCWQNRTVIRPGLCPSLVPWKWLAAIAHLSTRLETGPINYFTPEGTLAFRDAKNFTGGFCDFLKNGGYRYAQVTSRADPVGPKNERTIREASRVLLLYSRCSSFPPDEPIIAIFSSSGQWVVSWGASFPLSLLTHSMLFLL